MPAKKTSKAKTKKETPSMTEERFYYIYQSCVNNGTVGKPKIIQRGNRLILCLDDRETEVITEINGTPSRPKLISKE